MTTRDPSRFVLVSKALARGGGLFLCLTAGAVSAAGCGSDGSSSSDPFTDYEGVWAIDTDTSSLTCTNNQELQNVSFSLWGSQVTIAAGVLTDLVEVQGSCQFNYNVDTTKHVATLANPDPYTGKAPVCNLLFDQTTGENAIVTPLTDGDSAWTFQLLAPVKDAAPTAQIVGAADVALALADTTTGQLQKMDCRLGVEVQDMHKIAKP